MKCSACGYLHEEGFLENGDWGLLPDSEEKEFIVINITATIERNYGRIERVSIYACPECKTLQAYY